MPNVVVGQQHALPRLTRQNFFTTFDKAESPVSQGGAFVHNGALWALANVTGGVACGSQAGTGAFDDSFAYVPGFAPDVQVHAVVHRTANFAPQVGTTREVELHVRWQDSAKLARGYEVTLPFDASYSGIVRWDGPLATGEGAGFTTMLVGPAGWGALQDGDVVMARIIGTVITVFVRGSQLMQVDVAATAGGGAIWTDGSPGMGFWRGGPPTANDQDSDFGFKAWGATAL